MDFEPKILAFLCNWCAYAGADAAGISRFQYPPQVRIIRVPCSSRVNPQFIIRALAEGMDGVLVAGCHPGSCHYQSGNYYTRRRFSILKNLLEYIGLEAGRVQLAWISASEGDKFAIVIRRVIEDIKRLGPQKLLLKTW